jgi:hypothetical protein
MQKSRRWRGLELDLLSVVLLVACAGPPHSNAPAAPAESAEPPRSPVNASAKVDPLVASDSQSNLATPVAPMQAEPAPLPKGTRVLQIGDSFADALGGKLSKLFRAVDVKTDLEFETPSYIPNWSYGSKLPKLLASYHPDLVLITLGANEIEIPHPEERIKPVKHLVETLGGRPCVWIAPPLWKPDSGVLQVIRDNVAPCRYLDSNLLVHDLPRARDKIHPSTEGREIWAKVVFDWLAKERVGTPEQPWAFKSESSAPATDSGEAR